MKSLAEDLLALAPAIAIVSDEEWAERDAKVAAEREAIEAADAKRNRDETRDAFVKAGWPLRALEAAAVADEAKQGVARVRSWDVARESVLVLSGAPGTGKTTAAAHWALKRWPIPAFVRATTFAASSRYNHEQRDQWLEASALVLDDLGSEYADAKGNFLVDLDELVDRFYGNRRPLLVTTNCTAAEFKSRYGKRIVDRFRECGSWFEIGGGSLRSKP